MRNNEFGRVVKELRLAQGLSQRQLGGKLGVCNQTVSFWESGKREPDLDSLIKISDYFGVTVDYLLGKSEY